MKKQLAIALLGFGLSTAHAGWMDAINAAAQLAGAVQQPSQAAAVANAANAMTGNAAATANMPNTAPLSSAELERMDCAALELSSLRTQRDLETAKATLKSLDDASKANAAAPQNGVNAAMGLLGGLMASQGGKNAQYGQIAQQMSGTGNAAAINQQIDVQLALGKKYLTDIESIAVYQKYKKCAAPR